jgi:hypothetical protein
MGWREAIELLVRPVVVVVGEVIGQEPRALQSLVKDADGATAQALAAYALGTADSTLFNSTNFGARQGGHVDGDGRMVHGACSCWWSSTVRRGKAKALCIGGCDAPADGSDRSFPMDAGLAVRCMKR